MSNGVRDRYKTRSQIIFETLKDEIMLGAIMPGAVLDQEEIAARFQVSRIPVHEALRMLAMERTVELRPHHRAVVRKFSTAEIEDLFLIRSVLEPRAGAMACAQIQPSDLVVLRDLIGRMEPLNRSDELVQYLQLNRDFHMGIYRLVGSTIRETLICPLHRPIEPVHPHLPQGHRDIRQGSRRSSGDLPGV